MCRPRPVRLTSARRGDGSGDTVGTKQGGAGSWKPSDGSTTSSLTSKSVERKILCPSNFQQVGQGKPFDEKALSNC